MPMNPLSVLDAHRVFAMHPLLLAISKFALCSLGFPKPSLGHIALAAQTCETAHQQSLACVDERDQGSPSVPAEP